MTTNIEALKQAGWSVQSVGGSYVAIHPKANPIAGFHTVQQAWDYAQRIYDNYPITRHSGEQKV
jgi:hypothetical protein